MKILYLIDHTVLSRDKKRINLSSRSSQLTKGSLFRVGKYKYLFYLLRDKQFQLFLVFFFCILPISYKGCASQSCSKEFTAHNRSYKRVFSSLVLFRSFYSVQNFGVELKFSSIVPLEHVCLQQSVSFSSTGKQRNVTWK